MPDRCPICARPTAPPLRPFCSQGCKDRDLLRWLGEGYRLPGTGGPEPEPRPLDSPEEGD